MTGDDWPSHQSELSRKTLATLEDHMQRHNDGRITLEQLHVVVGALWDTTAGLVDRDVMNLLSAVHEDIRKNLSA